MVPRVSILGKADKLLRSKKALEKKKKLFLKTTERKERALSKRGSYQHYDLNGVYSKACFVIVYGMLDIICILQSSTFYYFVYYCCLFPY